MTKPTSAESLDNDRGEEDRMPRRLTQKESRARTRRLLVSAAERLFAKQGYHATSIEEIVDEAGFTTGAFYYNFASREDLLVEVVEKRLVKLGREVVQAMDPEVTAEGKVAAARAVFERYHEQAGDDARLDLELLANALREPSIRRPFAQHYQRVHEAFAELVAHQFDQLGVVPPLPPSDIALALMAMTHGLATLRQFDLGDASAALLLSVVQVFLQAGSTAAPSERARTRTGRTARSR